MFEKMMMEEALALLMQGSESAEILLPQPAVVVSASQVHPCAAVPTAGAHSVAPARFPC